MTLSTVFFIGHLVGLILGLGSATVGDTIVFRALKTKRLSTAEFQLLQTISRLIWLGLTILILSGIGLVLIKFQSLADYHIPAKLWLKFILTAIIAANGLFIHYRIYPLLAQSLDQPLEKTPLASHFKALTRSGAISVISWWSAFLLGSLRGLPFSLFELFAVYLSMITIGLVIAPAIGQLLFARPVSKNSPI